MNSLEQALVKKIDKLEVENLKRKMLLSERLDAAYVNIDGKQLVSFGCNDYLGLSHNNEVKKAAINAIRKYGVGAGASRLITGNNVLYKQLENKISKLKKTEETCVFGSGYLTNIGVITALAGKDDLVVADRLVHACIIDGAKLSGAKFIRFKHNDLASLEETLNKNRKNYKNCLIITENIFSMDGDKAPINELVKISKKYDCQVLADDAHGLEIQKDIPKGLLQMGTLSKSIGAYGGYITGNKAIIDYVKTSARSLMFSTALPPSVLASALRSIEIIGSKNNLHKIVADKAVLFCSILKIKSFGSAIVPIIIGDIDKANRIAKRMYDNGFFIPVIRPPTVAKGTTRLRFSFSVKHKDKDIIQAANILKELL